MAQIIKNPPAMQETWVRSLGWEDPLEEGMATHSSILAWRIPVDRGAWRATVHGVAKSRTRLSDFTFTFKLYSPWNSLGQNAGVGSRLLLQGIFPIQGLNPGLPHCRKILYQLSHQGSPRILEWVAYPFSRGFSQPRN